MWGNQELILCESTDVCMCENETLFFRWEILERERGSYFRNKWHLFWGISYIQSHFMFIYICKVCSLCFAFVICIFQCILTTSSFKEDHLSLTVWSGTISVVVVHFCTTLILDCILHICFLIFWNNCFLFSVFFFLLNCFSDFAFSFVLICKYYKRNIN